MQSLKSRFTYLRDSYNQKLGMSKTLNMRLKTHMSELQEVDTKIDFIDKCVNVFQALSEVKKEEIKQKIEALVTKGLRTIFERNDYRFELQMETKRGVMNAKPMLYTKFNDKEFGSDIIDSHGGGIVDVTSFLLQIITLLAFSYKLEKILICDEPFKHVSREYLSNVAEFISYLNEISGIQIIMVTHKQEFLDCANKKFEVKLNKDQETIIKELK